MRGGGGGGTKDRFGQGLGCPRILGRITRGRGRGTRAGAEGDAGFFWGGRAFRGGNVRAWKVGGRVAKNRAGTEHHGTGIST